jgi:Protein of unknown function (DUF642)
MLRFAAILLAVVLIAGCTSPSAYLPRSGVVPATRARLPDALANAGSHCPRYAKGSGILSNGDFHEEPNPAGYLTFSKGQVLARFWTVTKLNINFVGTAFWDFDKLCSVDLDGESAVGGIAHRPFSTTKGATYTLSFLLSGNSYCGPTIKTMNVSVTGHSWLFKWNTANNHDVEHGIVAKRHAKFTATSSTSTLTFNSLDTAGSGCGPVIGAIGVSKT